MTPRLREVRQRLLSRKSAKVIAHDLGITLGTMKVYTRRLYECLNIDGRVELMAIEIERLQKRS
jgi:DNA-binding NarL/FixJ family response regulator